MLYWHDAVFFFTKTDFFSLLKSLLEFISFYRFFTLQTKLHPPKLLSQLVCGGCGNATASHQPSHQDEPGGAVIEGVLAVTEDVRALFGAGIGTGVVHESLIINQVRHLALALVRQFCYLRVSGGEGRRGCAVSQVLINTTVEDGGAETVGSLGRVARTRER